MMMNGLILIYIKDNSPEGKIVIEDKCNYEKYFSDEYQSNEIFKASDKMVDSLTQLLYRERSKNVINHLRKQTHLLNLHQHQIFCEVVGKLFVNNQAYHKFYMILQLAAQIFCHSNPNFQYK